MPRRRLAVTALIVVITLALDQWTKALARAVLATSPSREYLGGLVTLLYAENSGAFLSLGSAMPPFVRTMLFTGLVVVALAAAIWVLVTGRVTRRGDAYSLALLIGGGIGNVIDRIARDGRVTDFIYLSAGPLHTGVFNVADMAITGAVIWLALTSARKSESDQPSSS
ncbi:MAG: signal peptidase Aspartic peptidase, family [Acidobacteria bacterium]|nr:signal peptidase Aspartic peptidase, family [Acidobacteriota bacterium]